MQTPDEKKTSPNRDYNREYRDNGKENGNYHTIMEYLTGIIVGILNIKGLKR